MEMSYLFEFATMGWCGVMEIARCRAGSGLVRPGRAVAAGGPVVRPGRDIFLTKRIPMGGGLGGGSSDAATTLAGIESIMANRADVVRSSSMLGLRLGADVPVFVFGTSAFAEGVGEQLQALRFRPPAGTWCLAPEAAVSTAEIFCCPRIDT